VVQLFRKYKSVIRFILLFSGVYLVLSFFYIQYLDFSRLEINDTDAITKLVARQSREVISEFGYQAAIIPHESEPNMKLFINEIYLARIIEGCNAISIIILFTAFVIAFAEGFKKTFLFLLAGVTIIYAMNIARIAIFAIALYHHPQYESVLHGVVFPGLIYGTVFLLWMLWVRMLKSPEKQSNE
jgi:exosortase family protein XrtF